MLFRSYLFAFFVCCYRTNKDGNIELNMVYHKFCSTLDVCEYADTPESFKPDMWKLFGFPVSRNDEGDT